MLGDVQVKVEEDIGQPDDQFLDDNHSLSPTADVDIDNKEEMDAVKNEVEDDLESAFCIIPDPPKRGRGRPRTSNVTDQAPRYV